MTGKYWDLLRAKNKADHFLCVGLDPNTIQLPNEINGKSIFRSSPAKAILEFNQAIIKATSSYACAYKPNLGYYLRFGPEGLEVLIETVKFIHDLPDNIPVILDGKFGDTDKTNHGYVEFSFDVVQADAVTVHPYLGSEAMQPFLDCTDKGIYVLCRTSNSGASEVQNLRVSIQRARFSRRAYYQPLYLNVAETVRDVWDMQGNCGLVAGATYPEDIRAIREACSDTPLLIPGIGEQGGNLRAAIRAAAGEGGRAPFIINVSSAICHASSGMDFAEAASTTAKQYHQEIMRLNGEFMGELASYND